MSLPPLSCGGIWAAAAIAVEESDSAAGQVLLLGGSDSSYDPLSRVQLVDLATGVHSHHSPTSSAGAHIQRRHGCQTVAWSARGEASMEGIRRRRRFWARQSRARRTQHGPGQRRPPCLQGGTAAVDA